jgi:TP901 family phage tail tape measure protein
MADIGSVKYQVELDQSGLDKDIKSTESTLSSKLDGLGGKLNKQFGYQVLKDVGSAFMAAGKAAVGFAADAVQTGATFDSAMSQVAATMGTTVDQIQDLRDFAQEMGATTSFSATQAAEALNYMALAGYDAETSMAMLPNVLNLAAAGGIDLAYASDMVTDASSALGLSLDETSALVDKMAAASSRSNTSVEQLGEAILTVGGTAKMLSGGTTELSMALGVLADNGIKGSEGGTALRNMILSLSAPTDKAGDAIEALGLQVFDAEGKMRPLNDIFLDLGNTLDSMTDQERTEVLNEIFNKVDLKSVNAMLGTSAERFDELAAAIDNSAGAAEQMANTQLDNLQGDLTLMQSALEGVQIAISDALSPTLREFVQMATEGLSGVATALQAGDWEGAVQVIADFAVNAVQAIVDMLPSMLQAGVSLLETLVQGVLSVLPELATSAVEIVTMLVQAIADNMPLIIDTAVQVIMTLVEGLIDATPQLLDAAIQIVTALAEYIMEHGPEIVAKGGELVGKLIEGLIAAIPKLVESVLKLDASIKETFMNVDWLQLGRDIINGVIRGLEAAGSALWDAITNIARGAFNSVKSFFGISSPSKLMRDQIGKQIPAGMAEGIEEGADEVDESMRKLSTSALGTISYDLPDLQGYAQSLGASISARSSAEITVPLYLDGREIARGSAYYMNEQLAWEAR